MVWKLLLAMNLTIVLLFGLLFALVAGVGFYFNLSTTVMIALAIGIVFIQWLIGPSIVWWTTNMHEIKKNEYPWIFDAIDEFCKKNGVPQPKKIAIVMNGAPNAFVFGRTPGSATLAITQGLLNGLNKDEVKAVISHELGHIKHKDMVVMTFVSVVPMIAYYLALNFMYGNSNDERRNVGASILVGIVAYLIYIISNLLILALSRLRESYADDFGGRIYKPALLASALTKITYSLSLSKTSSNDSLRSFYIADPVASKMEVSNLSSQYSDLRMSKSEVKKAMDWERRNIFSRIGEIFRTHPLTYKRVDALMELEKELKNRK